jgi:hypothetical protein
MTHARTFGVIAAAAVSAVVVAACGKPHAVSRN